ncbi:kinase-like protein [Marasmius fiardii PR-910]|nr:kinase-like protein [Marasmius fiardii PR-910]
MSTPSFSKKDSHAFLSRFGSGLRRARFAISSRFKGKHRDSQTPSKPATKSDDTRRIVEDVLDDEQQPTFKSKIRDPQTSLKPANLDGIRRIVEDVLDNEQQSRNLLETKGEDAQLWLDALQALAELPVIPTKLRSSILKTMLHLSRRSGLYPQCFIISNVKKLGAYPVSGGGFGDVWKGTIGDQIVCLKVVKVYLVSEVKQLLTQYMREAMVWKQLKHPNLLPFMGMYYMDPTCEQLCLVSPWMERGNLVRYLKETPADQVDHYSLVSDVASGLSYLHSREFAHGDLKGVSRMIIITVGL